MRGPGGAARLGASRAWRERFARWALRRHGPGTRTRLGQHNIYVLPSAAGWMFGVTLLVLLVASINYQLNLGYALTFLLAGSGLSSLAFTHRNLRGVELSALDDDAPLFAGLAGELGVQLAPGDAARWGLLLAAADGAPGALDVAAAQPARCALAWTPARRGVQPWPRLRLSTRWPLGLWQAWSVWQPRRELWVCPKPELDPPPLPDATAAGSGSARDDELDELRAWRHGDALRQVMWRKSTGLELTVRAPTPAAAERWLDWNALALPDEARLQRLCAWVLAADAAGERYGLRLPGFELAPAGGAEQRLRCLRALAECVR